MKNLKIFVPFAALVLLILAGQSCKKSSAADALNATTQEEAFDPTDNSVYSEEFMPLDDDDPIYESDAAATVALSGGTKALANEDAAANCTTFKYVDQYKVGYGGNSFNFSLLTANMSQIDSIVNENSKTGKNGSNAPTQRIIYSNVTMGVDTNHWTVKCAASSDTFRQGSTKMAIYYKINGVAKTKNVTVKCVGVDANVNTFGTQKWGLMNVENVATAKLGDPTSWTAIDTSYQPQAGDVIAFGSDKKGVILYAPTVTDPKMSGGAYKTYKYKFSVVQWNAKDCKSSRTKKNINQYKTAFPDAILSADGTTKATKYKR